MGNETSQQIKYGDKLDNNVTVTWNKLASDCPFPARDGHVSCGFCNQLFVFGGVAKTNEFETEELNDLLCLDLETKVWSLVDVNGEIPPARVGASMQQIGGKLYLFGGLSHVSGWFQDLHVFDIASSTWSKVTASGSAPRARDKLSSAVIGTKMYIFGGFGPQGEMPQPEDDDGDEEYTDEDEVPGDQHAAQFGWFNDMHILDTETLSWSCPMYMNLGLPTQRAAAGMSAVDKYLVIFGGRDSESRKNDLHIYNTESRKWETDLKVIGRQPAPRSFHTVTTIGPRVVVIGGRGTQNQHFNDIHIFDTLSRQWLQPNIKGDALPARGVHTATLVGDQCIIYGGTSDFSDETMQCHKYHTDVFMFNTAEMLAGKAISNTENKENTVSPNIQREPADDLQKPAPLQGEPENKATTERH